MTIRPTRVTVFAALVLGLTAVQCNILIGLDEFRECNDDCPTGGSGGSGTSTSTTGTGA